MIEIFFDHYQDFSKKIDFKHKQEIHEDQVFDVMKKIKQSGLNVMYAGSTLFVDDRNFKQR